MNTLLKVAIGSAVLWLALGVGVLVWMHQVADEVPAGTMKLTASAEAATWGMPIMGMASVISFVVFVVTLVMGLKETDGKPNVHYLRSLKPNRCPLCGNTNPCLCDDPDNEEYDPFRGPRRPHMFAREDRLDKTGDVKGSYDLSVRDYQKARRGGWERPADKGGVVNWRGTYLDPGRSCPSQEHWGVACQGQNCPCCREANDPGSVMGGCAKCRRYK